MSDDNVTNLPGNNSKVDNLLNQIKAENEKAALESVKSRLKVLEGEKSAAEKIVRLKSREIEKIIEDFKSGLLP